MKLFINEVLKPWCAVCDKPVERLNWVNDIRRNKTMATAFCHGQRESCELENDQQIFNSIEPGMAFVTKRIEQ